MSRTLVVDQEECTGCNLCAEVLPEVFELDEEGLAQVVNQSGGSDEQIQECIDDCPVSCISWKAD